MTSDRVLSHLDTLGRALREALAVLRDSEVREAVAALSASPTEGRNGPQREASGRVAEAVELAEAELARMRAALR